MLKQFAFRGAMRDSVDREQSKALSGGFANQFDNLLFAGLIHGA